MGFVRICLQLKQAFSPFLCWRCAHSSEKLGWLYIRRKENWKIVLRRYRSVIPEPLNKNEEFNQGAGDKKE